MTLTRRAQLALLGIAAVGVLPLSALTTSPAPQVLACGTTASVSNVNTGDPYGTSCINSPSGSSAIGAAPDAQTIIACRDVSGCLSGAVNNPGRVAVPHVSTGVQQSQ